MINLHTHSIKKILPFTALMFAGLLLFVASYKITSSDTVAAAAGSDWRSGQIIDDSVFYNGNDMSVQQIQQFLNDKINSVGGCDTNGARQSELGGGTRAQYGATHENPAPYICINNYYESPITHATNLSGNPIPSDGISAAQIIYNAATTYNISARALIVIIQKESPGPLLTDTWPFPNQYKNALGFGCPDTAPCDPQYAGFMNQVNNATHQFNLYKNNATNYRYKPGVANDILYNPSSACGSSTVYVSTRATAGLYNYTPYQPDQAALANLYGGGDSCSSYGNRNFWRMYRDWFGATLNQYGTRASNTTSYATSMCNIGTFSGVGRLYDPDTLDYLYTTSSTEACSAIKLGYIWDGVVFQNVTPDSSTIPIYRLRNTASHVYAIGASQRDSLVAAGFSDEGIIFYGYTSSASDRLPVFKLGQDSTSLLTDAGGEGTYLVNTIGYSSLGIGFYTPKMNQSSQVLRLRKGNDRLYTVSPTEANNAVSAGYIPESNTGLVDTFPDQYSSPVYRLTGPGGRLYTSSRTERDIAVINYGYYSEGIGFYSYPSNLANVQPVYRSTNYFVNSRLYTASQTESTDSRTFYGFTTEGVSWYSL